MVEWNALSNTVAVFHAFVYEAALLEEVAALHDAMSHCVYLVERLECADLGVEQGLEHEVDAFLVVGHVVHDFLFLAVGQGQLEESLVEPDSLYTALCQHRFVIHVV